MALYWYLTDHSILLILLLRAFIKSYFTSLGYSLCFIHVCIFYAINSKALFIQLNISIQSNLQKKE